MERYSLKTGHWPTLNIVTCFHQFSVISLSHPTHLGQFNGQKTKLQGGEGHWRLKYVNGNDLDHAFCVEKEQTGWLNHDSSMASRSGLGGGERIEGLEGMA